MQLPTIAEKKVTDKAEPIFADGMQVGTIPLDIITHIHDHSNKLTSKIIESVHTQTFTKRVTNAAKDAVLKASNLLKKSLGISGLKRRDKTQEPKFDIIIEPTMDQGQVRLDMEPMKIIYNQNTIREEQQTDEAIKDFNDNIETQNKELEQSDPRQTIMVKINEEDKSGIDKIEIIPVEKPVAKDNIQSTNVDIA